MDPVSIASIVIAVVAAITALLSAIKLRKCSFGCSSCLNSMCMCGAPEKDEDGQKRESPIVKTFRRITGIKPAKKAPAKEIKIKKKSNSPVIRAIRRLQNLSPKKHTYVPQTYEREFL